MIAMQSDRIYRLTSEHEQSAGKETLQSSHSITMYGNPLCSPAQILGRKVKGQWKSNTTRW